MSWLHCVLIIENWCWSLWGLKGLRWNPLGNWVSSVFKGYRVFSLTWPALCKFIGTKENVCIRKQFNSQRIGLGHQHGCRFIVLGHQYGRRDVMWKHSIDGRFSKGHKFLVNVWSLTGMSREVGGLRKNPFFGGGMDNFWNHLVLFLFASNGPPSSLLPLFTSFSGQRPAKWKWKWG